MEYMTQCQTSTTPMEQNSKGTYMSDEETLYEKGARNLNEVYAGDVVAMPEGTMPFIDVMTRTLFGEVWDRDVLSIRDRRLLLMGVIATQGQSDIWKIQAKSALKRGELSADELRETLIILAPYAGYPNVASLLGHCESAISEWEAEQNQTS
ncbi:MAG: carboxymuconolactone decarboxylase [Acidimicrobiaceae bacterium]|nr:carboxymuconolactone decarboxylase [Acidimicrobiaceae bacterium]